MTTHSDHYCLSLVSHWLVVCALQLDIGADVTDQKVIIFKILHPAH